MNLNKRVHLSVHNYNTVHDITTVIPLLRLVPGNSPPVFGSVNISIVPCKTEKPKQELSEAYLCASLTELLPHI